MTASTRQTPLSCSICDAPMHASPEWVLNCPQCGFRQSCLTPGAGRDVEGLEDLRRLNFELILDKLAALRDLHDLRVLEVGCAEGWFLESALRRGMRPTGLEPSAGRDLSSVLPEVPVIHGWFPQDIPTGQVFDLVVFNDTFEHLPDPVAAIQDAAGLLAPGGYLVINCPSSTGAIYRLASALQWIGISGPFERLWQRGLPSPHLTYFAPENLSKLASRHARTRRVACFPLPSLTRRHLYARVMSAEHSRLSGTFKYLAAYCLSFILPLLPPDIHTSVFEK